MKTLYLTVIAALFTFGAFAIQSPAYAHCGKCEGSHAEKMKPCEKTLGDKKPCTKCAKKKEHYHGDKPCKICMEHEKRWEMEKKMTKGSYTKTEKGDYQVMSRGPQRSQYND